MSLHDQFRLHYGEGKGKKVEADYRLFKLGYQLAMIEVQRLWVRDNFNTEVLVKMLEESK